MKYQKLLAATKTPEILAVIENLPVSANGFFLTEEQMDNVEAALTAGDTAAADLATANASLTAAQSDLATANTTVSTMQTELATAQARITELEAMGGTPTTTSKEKDEIKVEHVDAMGMDFQKDLLQKVD